ncbi:hypothetical protein ANO11243_092780 [Dothideomycetidae sp. 11243]|nr:hypothetical protein ANO11243_092780 [fungal sp. No.11243]
MLRWGVLGTSFISNTVVAAIKSSSASQVTAIFGRDAGRLEAFAEKHAIPHRCSSIDALVNHAEVDVVYVGLPSHLHAEATIAAARAGKAILSEKSLATTMADAHRMLDAVKQHGVFFLEGLMYLSHPLMQKVADIVRSGELGPLRSISGSYAANIWKKANPAGMGTIYNLGCYPLSLLHWIMTTELGPGALKARRIQALGNLADDGSHVRDAALVLRLDNGFVATLQSTDSFGNDFSFSVQGTKGSLRFKTNPWLPPAGKSILELKRYGGGVEEIVVESPLDAFGWQVKTVEKCVAEGVKEAQRPPPRWVDSIEIMEVLTEWERAIMEDMKGRSG